MFQTFVIDAAFQAHEFHESNVRLVYVANVLPNLMREAWRQPCRDRRCCRPVTAKSAKGSWLVAVEFRGNVEELARARGGVCLNKHNRLDLPLRAHERLRGALRLRKVQVRGPSLQV